jgi:hypothetical protein
MSFGHTYLCQKPKESVLANRGDSYWWFAIRILEDTLNSFAGSSGICLSSWVCAVRLVHGSLVG